MEFSTDEVERRTARRLEMSLRSVQRVLGAYADEYVQHARECEVMPEKPAAKPRKRRQAKSTIAAGEQVG